jgi:type I restriction enzyme, S subunit
MLQKDDVLICKDGAGIGKVGIVGELPDQTTINSSLLLIRSGRKILPKFLYRCLSSPYFQQIVSSRLNGATTPHLYQRDITEFPVVLPPLSEQQRIVSILDEAFEGIATAKANAEKNLQNARALFESQLQSVFTGRGKGWKIVRLSDVCLLINGRAYKQEEMLKEGKYPLLRVGNFFTNKDWFYSDLELEPEKYCDNGDLLYCWSASFGPRIWEGGKVIYHYHIWKVLPRSAIVEKRFLLHLLAWDVEQIKQAHGTGTTMMHVGKASMESRVVPVAPLQEQGRIVALLDELREQTRQLESLYQRKLAALEILKKSLLHQAFTGKV